MEERISIHGQWTSYWSFILATTGAAVGLGNIWKFPYIAGENGGGAFVIIYLICIVVLGVPILMAEIILGRDGRQNPASTLRSLAVESKRSPHWQYVGALTILSGFLILSYYSVIAGWALNYVFQSALGHFNNASNQTVDTLFTNLLHSPFRLLFWHTMIILPTALVIACGVEKGIERTISYLFPCMLVLLLLIIGYSIETGYFGHGLSFLFHPNFKALSANSILVALGHAFFTLSLATGSIMMYGAYVPRHVSIPKASFIIAGADTLIALLAGLAIFPIVFAHGLQPGAGPGLIFKTLPIAFGHMPYGDFFATLFFIMLVFAAFTSAISLLEPSVAWLVEKFRMSRIKATMIVSTSAWLLGIGTVFSFNVTSHLTLFGKTFFDLLDYLTANIMLPLGGLLVALFAAWFLRKDIVKRELASQNPLLYQAWHISLGMIAPVAIGLVFLHFLGIM